MTSGNVWKWAKRAYLAAYIAACGHIAYDSNIGVSKKLDNKEYVSELEVHTYKININGIEKKLTLAGECHIYNPKESEFAKQLVDKYAHIAGEGFPSSIDKVTTENLIYLYATLTSCRPSMYLFKLGANRFENGISFLAEEKQKKNLCKNYELENINDEIDKESFGDITQDIITAVVAPFTAPLAYYQGKNFVYNAQKMSIGSETEYMKSRDSTMGQSVVEILKKDDVKELLAFFGRGHLLGIKRNVSKQLKLVEITPDVASAYSSI